MRFYTPYLKFLTNRRILFVTLLGFSSGLPFAITTTTLPAWYASSGIDIKTIGFLSLVGLPYIYKFLWAPLMDRYIPPFLGRRRGWIFLTQVLLLITLSIMAFMNPSLMPIGVGLIALLLAFLSASQDIAIDAYRTDILEEKERGLGAALFIGAYRIAALISGGLALIIAAYWGWRNTYLLLAALVVVGLFASWRGQKTAQVAAPLSLAAAIKDPLKEFFSRKNALAFLLLILLYKLGDAFAFSLTTPFLLQGLHFTLQEVGFTLKTIGLCATLLGALIAGLMMTKLSLYRSLLYFGLLQAIANFTFMILAIVGKNYIVMSGAVFIENFCGGLGTAAFTVLLMSLCNKRFSATQFALFSSFSAVGRVLAGPIAGIMISNIGWAHFYFWTVIIALPALVLLFIMRKGVNNLSTLFQS